MTTLAPTPPAMRTHPSGRISLLLALVSAAAFGLSGSLAKSLLEIGWTPGAVVLARVGGGCLALIIPTVVLLRRTGWPTRQQSRRMIAYGVVAVALSQLCFFSAVQYLSVGVALLLEYLAPVMLIGWHWWQRRTPPAIGVFVGAAVAVTGMAFVLEVTRGLVLNPIGVLWGLGAAVCLCAYFVMSDQTGEAAVSPLLMTTVGTGVGALVILAAGLVGVLPLTFSWGATALVGVAVPWWVPALLLVGISAVLAYLTGIISVRRLGSSVASFVALSEVIFAVVFAVLLLGQSLSGVQLLGGALMLAGIAVVQRAEARELSAGRGADRPAAARRP